ncbi:hypothetical protein CEXT_26601 [Caerostris extrusa]|uniref:Uncharacterized protein n=1 Tax=Caerostris extrusa TaxID=172846 RepID=A0AAV4PM56_CAEEX|nr:hypothetical protein CEXT_26601 [Caerostris extrusa]
MRNRFVFELQKITLFKQPALKHCGWTFLSLNFHDIATWLSTTLIEFSTRFSTGFVLKVNRSVILARCFDLPVRILCKKKRNERKNILKIIHPLFHKEPKTFYSLTFRTM